MQDLSEGALCQPAAAAAAANCQKFWSPKVWHLSSSIPDSGLGELERMATLAECLTLMTSLMKILVGFLRYQSLLIISVYKVYHLFVQV